MGLGTLKLLGRRGLLAVLLFAVIAVSCGNESADELVASDPSTTTTSPVVLGESVEQPTEDVDAAPRAEAGTSVEAAETVEPLDIDEYLAVAEGFETVDADAALPTAQPENATGVYGFSRYVFTKQGETVVPTLIEGPRGLQVRCQEVEQQCSRTELQELYDSGAEIPDHLQMDRDTLGELVGQLAATQGTVDANPTIEEACAAGYRANSQQSPNMGIHMSNPEASRGDFDPARPQMVLYAKDGGETLGQAEQGQCVDGLWTGETGYESVGAVFTLPMTPEHPDAFAGAIDNWHIHYNTCSGQQEGSSVQEADTFEEAIVADGLAVTPDECAQSGGFFMEVIPVWMMHAYTDPDFDSQGGVFAMFNPSIWPVADSPDQIERVRVSAIDEGVAAPITNFDFGEVTAKVGETVVFSNSDAVPHTVTSGTSTSPDGDFDSGVFGTGQAFEFEFDEAGSYDIFCVLHPQMTGTVTVE